MSTFKEKTVITSIPTNEHIKVLDSYEEFRLKLYSELIIFQLTTLGRVDFDSCLLLANKAVEKLQKNDA